MIKLGMQELEYINMFEQMTRSRVKDCIVKEDGITFVVNEGDMGLAIGKNGSIIQKVRARVGKEVHVYEFSEKPEKFIANLLYPIKVERVEIDGTTASVHIGADEKKRAIGKGGKKIRTVREIIARHTPITEVKII